MDNTLLDKNLDINSFRDTVKNLLVKDRVCLLELSRVINEHILNFEHILDLDTIYSLLIDILLLSNKLKLYTYTETNCTHSYIHTYREFLNDKDWCIGYIRNSTELCNKIHFVIKYNNILLRSYSGTRDGIFRENKYIEKSKINYKEF